MPALGSRLTMPASMPSSRAMSCSTCRRSRLSRPVLEEVQRVLRPGGSVLAHLEVHSWTRLHRSFAFATSWMYRGYLLVYQIRARVRRARMRRGGPLYMHITSFEEHALMSELKRMGWAEYMLLKIPIGEAARAPRVYPGQTLARRDPIDRRLPPRRGRRPLAATSAVPSAGRRFRVRDPSDRGSNEATTGRSPAKARGSARPSSRGRPAPRGRRCRGCSPAAPSQAPPSMACAGSWTRSGSTKGVASALFCPQ